MAQGARKKSAPKKRAVLYVVNNAGVAVNAVKLRRDGTIFGRQKGDIILEDTECSSTHCQILNINNEYFIFDMNSTNGTYVNNERIVKSKLNEGDIVTLGKTNYKFVMETEAKVRHIKTVFKSKKSSDDHRSTVVDSLIESELSGQSHRKSTLELAVVYHDGTKESFSLPQRIVYLGRASSFGKFDSDPEISRKHMKIKLNDAGEIFIEDHGSTNGTWLNGKKISGMHQVKKSDTVKIGLITMNIWTNS